MSVHTNHFSPQEALDLIRGQIDRIDTELLSLLRERLDWAARTTPLKQGTRDPQREQQILQARVSGRPSGLDPDWVASLFTSIIQASCDTQEQIPLRVGFQGDHGCYSEMAAQKLFPKGLSIPCSDFASLYRDTRNGILDAAILPVENSITGPIEEVHPLLLEGNLPLTGEYHLPIHHGLLCLPGASHRTLREVLAHPQALRQCRHFLNRTGLRAVPWEDNALAARTVAREGRLDRGAIASADCARHYGLEVLTPSISDSPRNYTRFVVCSPQAIPGRKASLLITLPHHPGSLQALLTHWEDLSPNLTRLQSCPLPDSPFEYAFLMDIELQEDWTMDDLSERLNTACPEGIRVRVMGTYAPDATRPTSQEARP